MLDLAPAPETDPGFAGVTTGASPSLESMITFSFISREITDIQVSAGSVPARRVMTPAKRTNRLHFF